MANKMTAIINANVVLENGIIWDGAILLADGKIVKAAEKAKLEIPEGAEIIDAEGAYVGPGFVDIHVHGGIGENLFVDPETVAEHFLKHGETTILATPISTFPFDVMMQGVENIRRALTTTKNVKGVYMEGPYMNPEYGAGRGRLTWSLEINKENYEPLADALGDMVKVWSIAPERPGIMPFIQYVRRVNPNVVLSVGHSEATPEQVRALGPMYRPTLMTHIMNATGRTTGGGGVRGYGPDEYCLADNEMYAEMISDSLGVHVHSDLQRMIVKCKGIERVVLITDSTCSKGTPPPQYAHTPDINFTPEGAISGSKLTMDLACRNIMKHTNCGIAQAFLMASLNPARVVGMDKEIGSIEPGKNADLVFVDDKFNVKEVMVGGEICKF